MSAMMSIQHAGAENLNISLRNLEKPDSVKSLCWKGAQLFILGRDNIYVWDNDIQQLQVYVDLSSVKEYYGMNESPSEEEEVLWKSSIDYIFSDDKDLYGYHEESGQISLVRPQTIVGVYCIPQNILLSNDTDSYKRVAQIELEHRNLYISFFTPNATGHVNRELFILNLDSSTTQVIQSNNIDSYFVLDNDTILFKSDMLQSIKKNSSNSNERDYIESDEFNPQGFSWDKSNDRGVFYSRGEISTFNRNGDYRVHSYVPVTENITEHVADCSDNGLYAIGQGEYIFVRSINTLEDPPTVLRVCGKLDPSLLTQYSLENKDIVVLESIIPLEHAVLTGDSNVDLFVLDVPGNFLLMKEKGYIYPFTCSEIIDWVNTLYPEIINGIKLENDVYGVPISINVSSWTVDDTLWNSFDELENYPVNYNELFSYIRKWNDLYADQYPDYILSDVQQNGVTTLVSNIIKEYITQLEINNDVLRFDTPEFRKIMNVVVDNLDLFEVDSDFSKTPILYSYSQNFGVGYIDNNHTSMLLPPAISSDQSLYANIELLSLHAASEKKAAAEEFALWYIDQLTPETKYSLSPSLNEPLENASYFERHNTLLLELQELMVTRNTTDNSEEIENLINRKERQIKNLEEAKWLISQESIDCYRSIASKLRVIFESKLFYSKNGASGISSIDSVVKRFCHKGLNRSQIEAMIYELNKICFMIKEEME